MGSDEDDWDAHLAAAVLPVADAEQAELRARVADYENRITWHTTCGSCARILDSSIRETERAVRAEAALRRVRSVLEMEAVVGRTALDYRGLILSALMADDVAAVPAAEEQRSDVGTEFVQQLDRLDGKALDAVEADLAAAPDTGDDHSCAESGCTGEPTAAEEQPESQPFAIQVWPLARILAEVRCGSQDWTWDEEWADLDRRHAETGYLDKLEQDIRANGITMPVLIGTDGRLWDGHHRLRLAVRIGIGYVPVELPAAEEQPDNETPELAALFEGFARLLATSSRDWGTYRVDAWLYAVILGWDCEEDVHDDTCTHGAMEEMQQQHGWDDETVAKARRYRAIVRALTAPPAVVPQPDEEA
jgi:ParB-like chromosome segregation protein Spo0J